ncbi:MAG: S-layer homology domain-containing protein [Bacillota bacterium]|nr:S-layer homology domain-containing protein [Bacillota bacterium]
MKRKIALLLAVILIATLLPVQALAASGDKLIALTFDDGPAGSNTRTLLDGLRARGAHCTFFLCGYKVERYPEMIKQMWLDGHQIASHTYDHPQLSSLTDAQIRDQLAKTDSLLDDALGFGLDYMLRPPYGDYNDRVLKAANVPSFFWSMDTYDWKSLNADSVYNEFIKQARDGSIVLLHDSHMTSVTAALRAVDTLQARGYEFVTLSEMFYRRGITLENGHIYFNAYPGSYGTADRISAPVVTNENNDSGKQITISGDSRGAVYYTVNGETPNPKNSTLYTGPFTVSGTTTVKAVSVLQWNGLKSDVTTEQVKYTPAPTPKISFDNGVISISCASENAAVYYTCDGSAPDRSSELYGESFAAEKGTTYKARAYAPGYDPSPVSMLTYSHEGHLFTDIAVDDWCYETVDKAVSAGIFKGVTETEFAPNTPFTRAMLVTVLYRMAGEPETEGMEEPFTDIPENYWCYDALVWAYNNGIINGYDDNTFRPKNYISRQALCAMLARYMRYEGKDLSGIESGLIEDYRDAKSVSAGFVSDVDILCTLGIVRGYDDGTLRPMNGATRAQAATMIMRMLDAMDTIPDVQAEDEEQVIPREAL